MSDLQVSVNNWPVNRLALQFLEQAKAGANPQVAYVFQLAQWGLETDQVSVPTPLAPSQPEKPDLEQQVGTWLRASGPDRSFRAMSVLFSNPNLDRGEQRENLEHSLSTSTTPVEAAAAVVETIYALMVATSP